MNMTQVNITLSHEEVQETADRVAVEFKKLVTEVIINIHKTM